MQSESARSYGDNYSPRTTHIQGTGYVTTSLPDQFLSVILDPTVEIPEEILAYFRAMFRDQLHDLILEEFLSQKGLRHDLTQAAIARRLGKRPEQVNRWLGTAGNMTADTVSDLLLAISGSVPSVAKTQLQPTLSNYPGGPIWAVDLPIAGPIITDSWRSNASGSVNTMDIPAVNVQMSTNQVNTSTRAGV
jgi:hypothetical protein